MSNVEAQIRLTAVNKTYGAHTVLEECNLSIQAGEFVVVVGRSGSGKSTLLNLIGGLDRPTAGDVEVLGQSLAGLTEDELSRVRCRRLGFVFQFFNLIPTLTVAENVRLPMELNGASRLEGIRRADVLLGSWGLTIAVAAFPRNCRGANSNVLRSRGPCPISRTSCWRTSPRAIWILKRRKKCLRCWSRPADGIEPRW